MTRWTELTASIYSEGRFGRDAETEPLRRLLPEFEAETAAATANSKPRFPFRRTQTDLGKRKPDTGAVRAGLVSSFL